ncbi:hypothetical protein LXL04_039074 [Taraxacum kok-saghyz]
MCCVLVMGMSKASISNLRKLSCCFKNGHSSRPPPQSKKLKFLSLRLHYSTHPTPSCQKFDMVIMGGTTTSPTANTTAFDESGSPSLPLLLEPNATSPKTRTMEHIHHSR